MAAFKLLLALYLFAVVCFTLHSGGRALKSVQGGISATSTWRMMPNNASGNSHKGAAVQSYFPGINTVLHFAMSVSNPAEYYGARGVFSVHPLRDVQSGQETSGSIWIGNTMRDIIEAGWHVRPKLYNDNEVHFYVTWTADGYGKTGCFNLQCPGFVVQEGSSIVPGSILASVKQMRISIRKDSPSGDWRLYLDGAEVGRWPNTLFTRLSSYASFISLGGRVEFLRGDTHSPPMGSGYFPGGASPSASIKKLQYFDRNGRFVDFKLGDLMANADARECYDAIMMRADDRRKGGLNLFYGGPSGCWNYN